MAIENILVVDDSPTERHILLEILTKSGYKVANRCKWRGSGCNDQRAYARLNSYGCCNAGAGWI